MLINLCEYIKNILKKRDLKISIEIYPMVWKTLKDILERINGKKGKKDL